MHEKISVLFYLALFLYLITLFNVQYLGVYVTYISIPIIFILGIIMSLTKPKKDSIDHLSEEEKTNSRIKEIQTKLKELDPNNKYDD